MTTAYNSATRPETREVCAPRRLHAVSPQMCEEVGITSIPLELCDAIERSVDLRARFQPLHWVAATRRSCLRSFQRGRARALFARIAYRFLANGADTLRRRTIRLLCAAVRSGDVVLVYPGLDANDVARLRDKGAVVVHDPVNTAHPQWCQAMQRAHAAAGIQAIVASDERLRREEQARMDPGDLYFVTSPLVQSSIAGLGISGDRMIETTYGFNPGLFRPQHRPAATVRFVFVAQGSVRKGLPVLLRAWSAAGQPGHLLLVGHIDPDVASHCAPLLALPSVECRPYTRDLAAVYGDADVFVLTSFEEGSPLVVYLALAAGLPSLLSPPAAGWIARPGRECLLVEPDDVAAMAEALRQFADDADLRARLGASAKMRSEGYTWDKVASQRLLALEHRLSESVTR